MAPVPRRVVGLIGPAGSGKSTVAQYLVGSRGYAQESFAGALKDCVAAIFGWNREDLEGETPASREWRETVDRWWAARLNISDLTPRWVLRHFGTEVMRDGFHKDIWVASLQRRLHALESPVVVSDVRFPNEAEAIRDADGILVRIERPGAVGSGHVTETALEGFVADHTIVNDGLLQDLLRRVDDVL